MTDTLGRMNIRDTQYLVVYVTRDSVVQWEREKHHVNKRYGLRKSTRPWL